MSTPENVDILKTAHFYYLNPMDVPKDLQLQKRWILSYQIIGLALS